MTESLSDFLGRLELRGQCWCYVDFRGSAGFNLPPGDSVFFYAALQGSVRIAGIEGGNVELRTGDIAIILSGESHAVRSEPDSLVRPLEFLRQGLGVDVPPTIGIGEHGPVSTRLLAGRLDAGWPRDLRRGAIPPVILLGKDRAGSADSILRADAMQIAGVGSGSAALLTRLASLLLVAASRDQSRQGQPPTRDPIAQALALIASDPAASWSVERLARHVGMGRSSFAARFTAEIGRAPMEVVTDQRMLSAAALLRQGDIKIAEIAARVGYGSEGAFSRRFTRHFGLSPSQVRRNPRSPDVENSAASMWNALLAGSGGLPGKTEPGPPRRALRAVVSLTKFSA